MASKFPGVAKVVAHVRANVGAFCTQYDHNRDWGPMALDMLGAGELPEEILGRLLRADPARGKRQLAIIDMAGRAANRNPHDADPSGMWRGSMSGKFYACQGNTLVGREVIVEMARVYEESHGSLADRLMAALLAGDQAGGDRRGRLAAGLRIAGPGVPGQLLELDVDRNSNAVSELNKQYMRLRPELNDRQESAEGKG